MLTALDLFSGCGGLTLGLKKAGIQTIGAIEIDRFAAATFKRNFPDVKLFNRDIYSFSDVEIKTLFSGVNIVAGGPPCQGFSVSGPSQFGLVDNRNNLILEFLRFVKVLKPEYCIIENVKGILAGKLPKKGQVLPYVHKELHSMGYETDQLVLQAADFGVPQWRQRVFVIGYKGNSKPVIKARVNRKDWISVSEAISDLPFIDSGAGVELGMAYETEPLNDYQALMRYSSEVVFNHVAMKHTPRLIERFKAIPQGGSLVDAPAELGQRMRNGDQLDAKARYKSNNQRLSPNTVSLCVTASFQSNFIHPFLNRNLTAREGARLQSFPDNFIFEGPRTLMSKTLLKKEGRDDEIGLSQYNQIGNSVPPLLGQAIGEAIVNSMVGATKLKYA